MKNYLYPTLLLTGLWACDQPGRQPAGAETDAKSLSATAQTAGAFADPAGVTQVRFHGREHTFGTVREGAVVQHVFKFTNTGKVPLLIRSATAQCGCTVPRRPVKPIAPGATGEITVSFDSKGRPGNQRKPVMVVANTEPSIHMLVIGGMVEADSAAGK
jgi:hypothetical protein